MLFRYALRSVRRAGSRAALAIICIAFGVLSFVALAGLSEAISIAFLTTPRDQAQGDLVLERPGGLGSADLDALARYASDGHVEASLRTAPVSAALLRAEGSGRVLFVSGALGIDTAAYPIMGPFRLAEPAGASLADVLRHDDLAAPAPAIISIKHARSYGLALGDAVTLASNDGGIVTPLRVAGIATLTPDRNGDRLIVSLGTASAMQRGTSALGSHVAVRLLEGEGLPDSLALAQATARFEAHGWAVSAPATETNGQAADLFGFMLRASALLGLLLGGLGVANTMQVILARRTQEVATLKTLGYRARHLMLLFGIEATVLGLLGGGVGVLLGIGLGEGITYLLGASVPFLLDFTVTPASVARGLAVGVGTAVIFGLVAIVRTASVRPGMLLRQLPAIPSFGTRLATAGLYALLFALFAGLGGYVLGSLTRSIAVIAGGMVAMGLLGLLLAGILLLVVRLPLPGGPLVRLARRNLQRSPLRAAYALVAFVAGVLAIGLAMASLLNIRGQSIARDPGAAGYNVWLMTQGDHEPAVRAALDASPPDLAADSVRLGFSITNALTRSNGTPIRRNTVEGRSFDDLWWDAVPVDSLAPPLDRAAWTRGDPLVVVPAWMGSGDAALTLGDTLQSESGDSLALFVAGFYAPRQGVERIQPRQSVFVPTSVAQMLGGTTGTTLNATLALPEARLDEATDALAARMPSAFLVDQGSLNAFIDGLFRGLFWFALAIASLALVAGAVLIANAVGLAMVERQREMGVMKAIGYTRAHVLATVLVENAILGLVAGVMGWLGVEGILWALNQRFDTIGLGLTAVQAVLLIASAVLLAIGSAALVAWHPTRRRPLEVLRSDA